MNEPFRIEPAMPVQAYKSYAIAAPLETHWRPATCADIDCPDYVNGWQVRVEHLSAELLHAAKTSGRRYREMPVREGETYLIYEPGQPCFQASKHRKRLERPELYVVRAGDHRGNPTRELVELDSVSWTDDFGEHQERLADRMKQG